MSVKQNYYTWFCGGPFQISIIYTRTHDHVWFVVDIYLLLNQINNLTNIISSGLILSAMKEM